MKARVSILFQNTTFRYLFSVVAVAGAFGFRILLAPLIGTRAPFALFFAATLVTSLLAGVGPGLCTLLIGLLLAAFMFVERAGRPISQSMFQALLYGIDGLIIVYLTFLMNKARRGLQDANRQLLSANEGLLQSMARTRNILDLAPDAFFLGDLSGCITDVNQAACRMLRYERDELIGNTIFDIIPVEDAARLKAVRTDLLVPGHASSAKWTLRRRDGTFLPVEASSNMLPDGRWQAFVRDISERMRVEDELRDSENRFRTLAEALPQIIWITRPDGLNTYFNRQWVTYTGLTLEESYGNGWNIPFHPDDRQRAWETWQHAVKTDGVYSLECRLRRADGAYRWWLVRGVSLHDESGKVVDWFGTCTDVDDIKRAEEALRLARDQAESANDQLRESEERFRLAIDEAPIGMALVELGGRFVRVNRALCEILGYAPTELTSLTFQSITHPDDLSTGLALADQLVRGEISRCQFEKRYIRKDGSVVDVLLSSSLLRDRADAPLYYITQIEDITERKRADAALRLSEAKFSGIVSIAADAIISVDEDQRITIFNEGAESIFGYSKAEVIGTRLDLLIPERLRDVHREHFARFAASHDTARRMNERQDVFGLRKNGEEFPAEASISKVTVGGVTFFSIVLRDITHGKNIEAALRRAVTARDQVLGIVVHDLRNPLSTIILQCAALERQGPEPERRNQRPREIISRAAGRMNHLIQGLLDVTLVEAGQLKIERERLSASDLISEAVDAQRPLASSSGLEVRLDVSHDVHEIWGERDRLLQVFENLIGNAIKFTKAGGHITVGAASREDDVVFRVADTGSGIPPESLPHAFDRFWQAETRASRQGAGLGLPIAKGIVEAHGGRMWVESTVGRGSTFFFAIPKAVA